MVMVKVTVSVPYGFGSSHRRCPRLWVILDLWQSCTTPVTPVHLVDRYAVDGEAAMYWLLLSANQYFVTRGG